MSGLLCKAAFNIVDIFWVGRLGGEAIAAVTVDGRLGSEILAALREQDEIFDARAVYLDN